MNSKIEKLIKQFAKLPRVGNRAAGRIVLALLQTRDYYAMGLAGNRRTAALMDSILAHRTEKAVKDFNSLWMDGKDPSVLLTELTALLRDALMMKVAPPRGDRA